MNQKCIIERFSCVLFNFYFEGTVWLFFYIFFYQVFSLIREPPISTRGHICQKIRAKSLKGKSSHAERLVQDCIMYFGCFITPFHSHHCILLFSVLFRVLRFCALFVGDAWLERRDRDGAKWSHNIKFCWLLLIKLEQSKITVKSSQCSD